MSDDFKSNDLTEDAVRIGLLRLIHSAKKDDNFPGATARMLLDVGADLKSIEDAIAWLSGEDFIYVQSRRFLVTPKGLDYLDSRDEPPDAAAAVPRVPLPSGGKSSLASPHPETDSSDEMKR